MRPVVLAMKQIVDDPLLLPTPQDRYDHLNSLLQELVRRWEGRQGIEPSSARRTQAEVDLSIRVANSALEIMGPWGVDVGVSPSELVQRRKFINRALVSPLRDYSEQVLAHRVKSQSAVDKDEEPVDMPLLLDTRALAN